MRPVTWSALWSPAEDEALRVAYAEGGLELVRQRLPGRTDVAIFKRARRLGIPRRARWTAQDDTRLRDLWGSETLAEVARLLGRTEIATYWRGRQLGLQAGCPQGYEYLSASAARTGYTTSQLRRILSWAGATLTRGFSRPSDAKARLTHFIDPYDVDVALERWHATEPVHTAARARGLVGETLRNWLLEAKAAGVDVPSLPIAKGKRGRHATGATLWKAHWRVPTDVIDRVVAERLSTESVMRAAARHGVTRQTLAGWLRSAGIPRGASKVWRLPSATFDQIVSERMSRPTCRAGRAA